MTRQIIVFCEHYQREIERLNYSARYPDVKFVYYPARCGLAPLKWEELKESLLANYEYDYLHVVSGGCLKGVPAEQQNICNYNHYRLNQCFHMITNPDLVDFYQNKGCYLVTPGWLQSWSENLELWGFDRQTARNFFNETVNTVLLLDTTADQESLVHLDEFSSYIGLPSESIVVGLEYLDLMICNIILKNRLCGCEGEQGVNKDSSRKELADFNMALDLLNTLARMRCEENVIAGIKDMFTMLFAPRHVTFKSVTDAEISPASAEIKQSTAGFSLPVFGSKGLLGELELVGLELPQHLEQYLSLATKIVNICGLAIENARQYKVIKDLSDTDGLTKVANRRRLDEYLKTEWLRMKREGEPLALIMADVDYFKPFNDLYGHLAGDDCLIAVANALADHCYRPADLAARYGGEEFVMVLPNTDLEGAAEVADKMRRAVESKKILHEGSPVSDCVTVSFGVAAVVPSDSIDLESFLAAVDKLLFKAKTSGRNCVVSAAVQNSPDQQP